MKTKWFTLNIYVVLDRCDLQISMWLKTFRGSDLGWGIALL
jgi:hypothetical protein